MSNRRLAYIAVTIIAVVALLPFLGLTDFTTKGEPREAVVALSMLNDGNWILPVNNGGDIPYKPPFFHFCIALLSMFTGHVGEYTSRLPSALSLIAMTVACAHSRTPTKHTHGSRGGTLHAHRLRDHTAPQRCAASI